MSNFKLSKRGVHSDSRSTILEKDSSKIKEILEKEKKLPKLLKQLDKSVPESKQYNDIKEEMKKIKEKEELCDYLFNLADFLMEGGKEEDEVQLKLEEGEIEEKCDFENLSEKTNKKLNLGKFIHVEKTHNNNEMYNDYVNRCFNGSKKIKTVQQLVCKNCNSDTSHNEKEGITICYTCASVLPCRYSEKPEWNAFDTVEYIKPFSYKRSNHFKEWINQIQGREGTNIPEYVLDSIKSEIKKERINDKKKITYEKTKQFLKKLKLNKYYEHIPNIIHSITGTRQLVIDTDLENTLTKMFDDIQNPFKKHCPPSRKNFLSYSYTLYKFFQILKLSEYLIYFPLLKSREKLFEQETIWKNICKELDWDFIKCI